MKPIKVYLDSSAIETLRCPRLFKHVVIDGLKPKEQNNDLLWGSAVHEVFHHYYINWNIDAAVDCGYDLARLYIKRPKAPKTPEAIKEILPEFLKQDNFKPHIQKKTLQPIVEQFWFKNFYKTTNIEIVLCGVVDAIGSIPTHGTVIKDIKTTAATDENIIYSTFSHSLQMMLYSKYASEFFGYKKPLPIVIDAIMPKAKYKKAKRLLPPISFPLHIYDKIDRIITELCITIEAFIINNLFPMNPTQCKKIYQYECPFMSYCYAPDVIKSDILARDFEQRAYDPRTFGLGSLNESKDFPQVNENKQTI